MNTRKSNGGYNKFGLPLSSMPEARHSKTACTARAGLVVFPSALLRQRCTRTSMSYNETLINWLFCSASKRKTTKTKATTHTTMQRWMMQEKKWVMTRGKQTRPFLEHLTNNSSDVPVTREEITWKLRSVSNRLQDNITSPQLPLSIGIV